MQITALHMLVGNSVNLTLWSAVVNWWWMCTSEWHTQLLHHHCLKGSSWCLFLFRNPFYFLKFNCISLFKIKELSKRAQMKRQKRTEATQKHLEKRLTNVDISKIGEEFPDLADEVSDSFKGNSNRCNNRKIYIPDLVWQWNEHARRTHSVWYGRIRKLKTKRKVPNYSIAYWADDDTYVMPQIIIFQNGLWLRIWFQRMLSLLIKTRETLKIDLI